MKEWSKRIGLSILLVILLVILPMIGANEYTGWQCENYSEVTGREAKFISWDTCYIKVDDEWVRYDSTYRRVEH